MKHLFAAWRRTPGSPAPPPAPSGVAFDPDDGAKRVIITVAADGAFAPVAWYGMDGMVGGALEASNIAAHGALIMTEMIWRASVAPPAADGAAPDGE